MDFDQTNLLLEQYINGTLQKYDLLFCLFGSDGRKCRRRSAAVSCSNTCTASPKRKTAARNTRLSCMKCCRAKTRRRLKWVAV